MKIANIVGARPQFIKYFPISQAINRFNETCGNVFDDILIHTGQHYDYNMSKVFFDEFGMKMPEYHLEVGSGSHGEQTGQILQKVEDVLIKESPDIVLVYGDTNSTLGAALAAVKLHIPVAHIEAGLRSFNKYMPEEINRILTSNVSTLLFCPSKTAVTNLIYDGYKNILNEGELVEIDFLLQNKIKLNIKADKNEPLVINVGDVMYDVLLYALKIAEERSDAIDKLQLFGKQYYLLTLHRAEITDDTEKLHEIIDFVNDVSVNKRVVFPMHPRMKNVYKIAKNKLNQNVEIIKPMSYLDMLMLMKNSDLIMTDSGGMQKEAYWLKIPCITLRDETEWIETVQSGWNVLYKNYCGLRRPVKNDGAYYGDGKSSERIVSVLAEKLIEDKL